MSTVDCAIYSSVRHPIATRAGALLCWSAMGKAALGQELEASARESRSAGFGGLAVDRSASSNHEEASKGSKVVVVNVEPASPPDAYAPKLGSQLSAPTAKDATGADTEPAASQATWSQFLWEFVRRLFLDPQSRKRHARCFVHGRPT